MNSKSARSLIVLLASLSMIGPFAIDTFFPAFPAISRALNATPFQMQQTLSLYLVAYAVMALLHGGLSDALGRKPVILVTMAIFTLASVGCALAQTMDQLLAFRVLQGLSAGAGVIVGRAIVRDCFAGARAQRVMSGISMIFGIAPALAPIVGGYLLYFGWRAPFWFLVLWSIAIVAACWRFLPETHPLTARTPLHLGNLMRGYYTMLKNRRFVLLCFAGGFNFSAMFLYISSAPSFVMEILGMNERQFGAFFVPTISGMIIGSFASGRMAGRIQPRAGLLLGYGLMLVAGIGNIAYTHAVEVVTWPWAVLPITLTAFGVAIAFPLLTIASMDLFPERRGGASSLQMFLSLIVNASVAGLLAPLLQHDARQLAIGAALLTLSGLTLYLFARSAVPRVQAV
jgi:DHA1 family bicyclomycin/chloramphenicol resistance-like MFS transporter